MSPDAQPQVVILEEAHKSQYNTYVSELWSRTGQSWNGVMLTHCPPGAWNGSSCTGSEDEGVAVFSSFPVVDSGTKYLPYADAYHSARASVRLSGDFHKLIAEMSGHSIYLGFLKELIARSSLIILLYRRHDTPACGTDHHNGHFTEPAGVDRDHDTLVAHEEPISAGREITIDYNCPRWFAAQD